MTEEPGNSPAPSPLAEALPVAAPPPHLDRTDKLTFLFAALPAFVIYLATLPPEVTLGESGINATAAFYASPAGPPGYPAWALYAWMFTKLVPFSNTAVRVAVGSAFAGALTCGIVAMMISFVANGLLKNATLFQNLSAHQWQKLRGVAGVAAALVLGFTDMYWNQAVSGVDAEPWSFDWMLFAATLWSLTRAVLHPPGRGWIWLALFLYGLIMTANQELAIALPALVCMLMFFNVRLGRDLALLFLPLAFALFLPFGWSVLSHYEGSTRNWPMGTPFAAMFVVGVVAAILTRGVGGQWRSTLAASLGLLAGLAFYLYVPLAARTTPPVQWGYPRTLEGFLHLVARGQYERVNATGSFTRYMDQLWRFFENTGYYFGWMYLAVALVGVGTLAVVNLRARRWLAGLATVWICTGPLLVAMLNAGPDRQSADLTMVFLSSSWIVLAVLMGVGLITIGAWVARWGKEPEPAAPPPRCASS